MKKMTARHLAGGLCAMAAAVALQARAGSFEISDDTSLDFKATANYGLAIRTRDPDQRLINAPVEEFQSYLFPDTPPDQPTQVFRFERQGLSQSINSDDGDRNFKKGALIHNRLSIYGELQLHHQDFGAVLSGSAFYDDVYHHQNDNDAPNTVNKLGPDGMTTPDPDYRKFTSETRFRDGQRARLLEAYIYGTWYVGDEGSINLRLGQQLVAWGESLFLSGVASAQSQADATKAFVPGTEIKDILLPTNQVALNAAITNDITVLGYYKLDFRPNEIFPVGDYFSPADVVGPGARFVYGSANPLYGGPGSCQGLLTNFHIGSVSTPATPALENTVCNVILAPVGALTDAPPYIYTYRGKDINPSTYGQWGVGLKYQLTSITNVALYHLRYNDPNPSVRLNVGYAPFGYVAGQPVTTQIINQLVPVTYNVEYFGGIDLTSLAYTTVIGGINVAGEFNYRHGASTPIETVISGHLSPVYTRGNISQVLMSGLYVTNPRLFFDDLAVVGEVGYLHVNGVEHVDSSPGIEVVDNGDKLFYNRNSYGGNLLMIPTAHNILPAWDLSMPVTFAYLKGNPAMAGAFGALYGDGDMRASLGISMTYLENTEIGVSYNWFFGNPAKTIKDSTLAANPYADRDYATLNVKYNF
ncbi:DUF1302 domain-containing protein [Solimonas terrae]|uniref:DUF1302 domain-containing protein n=1 Tax=Solimonas terrae TaxID=1396819 RepID=A0A6M2BTM5_9GAMM|nr:DUF1302 family protein [Solimonas terrae]NGY05734.1 DUF1302 domain-containing protein [Solimonas terrae]